MKVFAVETCPWESSCTVSLGLTYTVAINNAWKAEAELMCKQTADICQGHPSSVPFGGNYLSPIRDSAVGIFIVFV